MPLKLVHPKYTESPVRSAGQQVAPVGVQHLTAELRATASVPLSLLTAGGVGVHTVGLHGPRDVLQVPLAHILKVEIDFSRQLFVS